MKKKLVSAVIGAAMAASMISGCGNSNSAADTAKADEGKETVASADAADTAGSSEEQKTEAKAETTAESTADGEKTKLSITYVDTSGEGEDSYFYKEITQAYDNWSKKDQVEMDIKPIVATESDYFTKTQLQMSDAGTCPDIYFEDSFRLSADVAAGYIADITEFTKGYEDWNNGSYIEAVKDGVTDADGNVFAIPCSTDSRGLLYNKEVFKQAGLPEDWQPKNWEDVLAACRAIKEKCTDVVPMWFSTPSAGGESTTMNTYEMILYGTGESPLYNESTGKWVARSQGILDSLGFIKTIFDEGMGGELSERLDANEWQYGADYLRQNKLGIYLMGNWFSTHYQEGGNYEWEGYEDKVGFVPMPTQKGDDGGYITMSGGWAWTVTELSKQKELAFEFITEIMKPDTYKLHVLGAGILPTRDMSEHKEITDRPFNEEAMKLLTEAKFRPKNEKYAEVSTHIAQMVEAAATGSTPEDAMETFATSVESIVGKENIQE